MKSFNHAVHDFLKPRPREVHGTDIVDTSPSLTRQEFAADADINEIMRRYQKTGVLPVNGRDPVYVDWTAVPSNLQDAMSAMYEAEAAFMTLPAEVRREFDNDPIAFVAFASNRENLVQMQDWGLAPKPASAPSAPGAPASAGAPSALPTPATAPAAAERTAPGAATQLLP